MRERSQAFLRYSIRSILLGSIAYLLAILVFARDETWRALIVAGLVATALAAQSLLTRGRLVVAVWTLLAGVWLYATVTSFFLGGVNGTTVIFYPLVIIAVGWQAGTRASVRIAVLSIVAVLGFVLSESWGVLPVPPPTPPTLRWILDSFVFFFSASLIAYVARSYRERIEEVSQLGADLADRSAELQIREAELHRAQAVAHVGSWVYDLATDTMRISAETCRIFDLPEGTTLSHDSYLMRTHPDDRAALDAAWQSALGGERSFDYEHRIVVREAIRWVRQVAEIEFDASGHAARAVGITQDITDSKRADLALRQSEASYRGLFDSVAEAIYIQDDEGRFVDVNAGAEAMYGYTRAEMIGRTPEFVAAPGMNDMARVGEAVRKALAGTPQQFQFWGRRKSGECFPKDVWLSRGTYFGRDVIIALAVDVTERLRTEAALRKRKAELKEAQRVARVGSWEWTMASDTLTLSDELCRALGLDPELPPPRWDDLAAFYTAESWSRVNVADERALQAGEPYELDLEQVRPDGTPFWTTTRGEVVRDTRGEIVGLRGTVLDITERKRSDDALRQSEERLRQAQKMEAIGQLAGGVAHDFNNLLTVILGNAASLAEDTLEPAEVQGLAKDVLESADRGAELTRQLLAFGRKQVIQVRPLNVNDLLANLVRMLRGLLSENIIVRCVFAEDTPLVVADAGMLEQVIVNLAVNARDAMPAGGSLTITTRCVEIGAAEARANPEARQGRFVALTVADTGVGMDSGTQAHMFEPFFTTKPPGTGTGLGLATVHGIVKQHDGWIEVASEVGRGSRLAVFLPMMVEGVRTNQRDEQTTLALPEGHETILVVEDETLVRQLAIASLKRRRYRVLEADSGIDAIRVWNEHRDEIDLLLTDMVMPGMSGRELAKRLRIDDPYLKVIYTSGYSREWLNSEPELLPDEVFLPKPYVPAALAQTVRRSLDGT